VKTSTKTLLTEIDQALDGIYDHGENAAIGKALLEDIIGVPPHQLPLNPELNLSTTTRQLWSEAIDRIKKHEPVQYITGKSYFYGQEFRVTPGVLIPRPETEELVALILQRHGDQSNLTILDIGTGSGCIAVSLASKSIGAKVTAIDISDQALKIAHENANQNNVVLELSLLDIANESLPNDRYDIIVSNPPYITEKEQGLMHKNVLEYEPGLALFVPDDSPLKFYEHIATKGKMAIKKGGWIYCEINEHFGDATVALFENQGYVKVELHQDMQGKDRMLSCQKP